MDRRESTALDRHITGNYGEDQFAGEEEFEIRLEQLLTFRSRSVKMRAPTELARVESELDQFYSEWRKCL